MTVQPVEKEAAKKMDRITNDFSMTVATKNGSGSQTSNLTLLRALFAMGIPVTGKNLFPSNIQGLPTWYTIRASKDGYLARTDTHEIVVAMNRDTFVEDYEKVAPGGAFFYADDLKFSMDTRDDIAVYPIPAKKLAKESGAPSGLRDYVANMAYVGVLAYMLEIDMSSIKAALDFHFKGKEKPIALNYGVIEAAAAWAAENLEKNDPYYVEKMDGTKDYIMVDGNTAGALGSIYGGVQFLSWYPITPATSLAEQIGNYAPELRDDPENPDEKNYAIVQTEDELAAIGMAVGAGWAGLRSMTSTSGPGISLMTEFIGLAYYSEVPVVVWNVQRVGPSTGMPTRTAQGDITMTYFLGHGDTQNVMLLPACGHESFEFGWRSFDIAEKFQTPVFVLIDLDLGMNNSMAKPFVYPDAPMDRGKLLWEKDLENWAHEKPWGRYLDVDNDGITYRTVPGNRDPRAGYFARGTGHDEYAHYTEKPDDWEKNMARLVQKFENMREELPLPAVVGDGKAKIGLIAYGTTDPAIYEARDLLAADGIETDYLRIRALPFSKQIREFVDAHERVYVIELNRDGQMHQIMKIEYPELTDKMVSIIKHDGFSLTAKTGKSVV